jgi:hypothetical protein
LVSNALAIVKARTHLIFGSIIVKSNQNSFQSSSIFSRLPDLLTLFMEGDAMGAR